MSEARAEQRAIDELLRQEVLKSPQMALDWTYRHRSLFTISPVEWTRGAARVRQIDRRFVESEASLDATFVDLRAAHSDIPIYWWPPQLHTWWTSERSLPIFGERDVDRALRMARRDRNFGSWLTRSARNWSALDGLLFAYDSVACPSVATLDEFEKFIGQEPDLDEDELLRFDQEAIHWLCWRVGQSLGREVSADEFDHRCARPIDPLQPPEAPGVYLVKGAGDFVKIGKAKNIAHRMREIQTGQPVPLELLAVLSPDPRQESVFHKRFAHLRATGEWFALTREVMDAVMEARRP